MKILICGTRKIKAWSAVQDEIIKVKSSITYIICGGASGVDSAASELADAHEINYRVYPAKWELYGSPQAGNIRNEEMLSVEEPDEVWAFKLKGGDAIGENRGTNNMIKLAEVNKIPVKIIEVSP